MGDGTDWVEDDMLSRDETMERFNALDPTPSEPETLHREVSRMTAGLVLFFEANTKGSIRMVADRFATEVLELVEPEIRAKELGQLINYLNSIGQPGCANLVRVYDQTIRGSSNGNS